MDDNVVLIVLQCTSVSVSWGVVATCVGGTVNTLWKYHSNSAHVLYFPNNTLLGISGCTDEYYQC